jgi:hypothetical protein
LTSRESTLIDYSLSLDRLGWYIYLLDSLNIRLLGVIVTVVGRGIDLFSETEEIVMGRSLLMNNLRSNLLLLIVPVHIYSLLLDVILSGLTVFIDKLFNIPS